MRVGSFSIARQSRCAGRWLLQLFDRLAPVRVAGIIVMVAAMMKLQEWVNKPIQWVLALNYVQVVFELSVGSWLAFGQSSIAKSVVAVVLYSAFACVSAVSAFRGAESCGCFGGSSVSPWRTFVLDVVVLAILAIELLGSVVVWNGWSMWLLWPRRLASSAALLLFASVLLVRGGVSLNSSSYESSGDQSAAAPQDWIGKRLPVLPSIDVHQSIERGEWMVVFYRPDCSLCREHLAGLRALHMSQSVQLALIEVPGGNTEALPIPVGVLRGSLDRKRTWFIQVPLAIRLKDGRVTSLVDEADF